MHPIRSRLALALVAAAAFAAPAGAEAFTVNSTADTVDANPGNGVCATNGSVCTLRAAIGEANALAGPDSIDFAPTFDGTIAASLINLGTTLQITTPITITGGDCGSVPALPKPCAEVRTGDPIRDFTVTADDVTIQGLSLTSASGIGIDVTDGQRTLITGNWFGRALDGSTPGNSTGVQIGPASSEAQIGGTTPAERNVFEGGVEGIQIRGDDNVIQGNTFGLKPDLTQGLGSIFAVRIGIAVNDPDPTSGNVVGGTDPGTPDDCDGPCNVFANAGSQIVLNDSVFNEVDGTTIAGNFFGYGLDGTPVSSANGTSIDNQSADATTIGGPTAADGNYIGGANIAGVEASSGAEGLSVAHNSFGLTPSGDAASPNAQADVRLTGLNPVAIDDNRFASDGIEPTVAGIEVAAQGGNHTIRGNVFGEGASGEDLGYGVPAVRLDGNQNVVGSDTPADYNTIENGDVAAIEVSGDDNEVLTNLGDNDGQFIDLIPQPGPGNDPTNGANGGIQAPVVTAASTTSAQGTRDGSTFVTVRVYRLNQQGIVEYLGQDGGFGGTWSVNFSGPVSAGQCIAATQTIFGVPGSTSELATPVAAVSGACDSAPPTTTIDDGPTQNSATLDTTPTFEFSSSSDPAATFQCRYENEAWRGCSGTGTDTPAAPLSFGQHTFSVRAVDAAGNPDPTPATVDFEVTAPPHTTSISLSCSPATVATGGGSDCEATVTDTDGSPTQPQGQVQFSTGATGSFTPASCTLAGASGSTSSCEVSYSPGAAGSHTISATYAGSAAHDGSGPATDDVTATSVHATDASLVCAPASVLVGNATTCEATIEDPTGAPSAPQGQVQITTNRSGTFAPAASCTLAGATVDSASCRVTYRPSALGGGTHQLTATYAGNATHAAGNDGFALAVTTTGPGPDTTAPDTTITDSPKKKLKRKKGKKKAKATFGFSSSENGSRFECQIDKKPAAACTSPKTYKLKKGKHKFFVTATDSSGNEDQTPATFKLKVR